MKNIKAVIFDWGRTLYDSEKKQEFSEAEEVLAWCRAHGWRLAAVSLVSAVANATLAERKVAIERSPLRRYFEVALVTDTDKDALFDQVIRYFGLPRAEVLIVDDRMIRGIRYGNAHGHPTVWVKKGKFAGELPNVRTGMPTHTITEISQLKAIFEN